jgi:hypothetical protein
MLQETIGLAIVAGELLDDIGTHVAVLLLHLLGGLQAAVRLTAVSQQALHKVCDVSASDGDALDGRSNDVALSYRDNVGDTVTGVNNSSGEGSISHFGGGPGRGKGEHGLNGNIETSAVERFEHDLGGVFTVLGGVQWLTSGSNISLSRFLSGMLAGGGGVMMYGFLTGSVRRK